MKWSRSISFRKQRKSEMQDWYCLPEVLPPDKKLIYGLIGTAGWLLLSYVFYRSIIPAVVTEGVFLSVYFKQLRTFLQERQMRRLRVQFQDAVQILSMHLGAGHSIENAIAESAGQMTKIEGENNYFEKALRLISKKIEMGISVEAAWREMAESCCMEEVTEFARALELSKRSGASMIRILQRISQQMVMKLETENQIDTMLAGKRMEQNIMNCMPAAILLYVSLTSPELLRVMYESMNGRIVMTVCLIVYGLAYYLSAKITRLPERPHTERKEKG